MILRHVCEWRNNLRYIRCGTLKKSHFSISHALGHLQFCITTGVIFILSSTQGSFFTQRERARECRNLKHWKWRGYIKWKKQVIKQLVLHSIHQQKEKRRCRLQEYAISSFLFHCIVIYSTFYWMLLFWYLLITKIWTNGIQ